MLSFEGEGMKAKGRGKVTQEQSGKNEISVEGERNIVYVTRDHHTIRPITHEDHVFRL